MISPLLVDLRLINENINHVNAMLISRFLVEMLHEMMNLNCLAPPISCSIFGWISSSGAINK